MRFFLRHRSWRDLHFEPWIGKFHQDSMSLRFNRRAVNGHLFTNAIIVILECELWVTWSTSIPMNGLKEMFYSPHYSEVVTCFSISVCSYISLASILLHTAIWILPQPKKNSKFIFSVLCWSLAKTCVTSQFPGKTGFWTHLASHKVFWLLCLELNFLPIFQKEFNFLPIFPQMTQIFVQPTIFGILKFCVGPPFFIINPVLQTQSTTVSIP